jgi:PAS domain S-box-containing protein
MKIKTKLRLTAIGLTGIAMIVSLFLFYMTRRIDESLARGELARQIVKGTFELSLMTHDFLLHHSERAVKQWRLKHESLSNLISPGMFGEENEKVIIEKRILQNHKAAGILFDQVVADYTRRRDLRGQESLVSQEPTDRTVPQLVTKTHMMLNNASLLRQKSDQEIASAKQRAFIFIISSGILMVILVASMSFHLSKDIGSSLRKLHEGTEIISVKSLDSRIDIKSNDEIGQVASAFNEMTGRLASSYTALEMEIAERKQAEAELARHRDNLEKLVEERTAKLQRINEDLLHSEQRISEILASITDCHYALDNEWRVTGINDQALRYFGMKREDFLGKSYWEIFPMGVGSIFEEKYKRVVSERVPVKFELKPLVVDRWAEVHAYPTEEGLSVYFRDITERKQMEEELRKSRDELEIRVQERTAELMSVVEALQNEMAKRKQAEEALREHSQILEGFFTSTITPLVFLDKEFNFIRVNEAYAKACQREVSEFPGHNHFEFYPSDTRAIFEQVVQTKEPYQAIARPFTFPDHPEWGVTYWDWTLTPLLDDMSEVEFLVFSLEDVTERKRAEEALRQNEELLRIVLDTLPVGVWVADKKGKLIFGNPAGQKIWGGAKYVGIDQYYEYKGWRPENGKRIEAEEWAMARAIRKGETSINEEIEIESLDGIRKTILASAVPIRDANQEIAGGIVINQEITERKEVERRNNATNALLNLFSKKSLRKEYFDAVVDLIQNWSGCRCVGIRVLDKQGLIPYESYVGFSKEFWESENSLSIKRDQCACIRVITGNPDPQDASMMTPGGSFHCGNTFKFVGQLSEEEKARFRGVCVEYGFLSVCIVPVRYREEVLGAIHLADEREGQVPLRAMEFIEPMAPLIGEALNRFNLEEEIRESENRLRALSSQLLTVQENERKRIARDIHDSIGQSLSAIKFRVENILEQTGKGPAKKMVQPLQTLIPIIQQSIEESRRIQMDLRPSVLDDLGIVVTCSWFCREFQTTFPGIHIEKKIEIEEDEVPQSLKTVIYRIMQEAMNNIAKHSKASAVSVSLKKREGEIDLIIQDNGQGFDIKETFSADGSSRGMGLASMRERAELSGGSFSMESVPGKGTTIRATWNL